MEEQMKNVRNIKTDLHKSKSHV